MALIIPTAVQSTEFSPVNYNFICQIFGFSFSCGFIFFLFVSSFTPVNPANLICMQAYGLVFLAEWYGYKCGFTTVLDNVEPLFSSLSLRVPCMQNHFSLLLGGFVKIITFNCTLYIKSIVFVSAGSINIILRIFQQIVYGPKSIFDGNTLTSLRRSVKCNKLQIQIVN